MNLLWYRMIDPTRGGITEIDKKIAFTQRVQGANSEELDASLFLDDHGEPHFVKIRVFGAKDMFDTERFIDLVDTAFEHMLSVLKLTWHRNATYVPLSVFCPEPDDGSGAGLQVEWPSVYGFNPSLAAGVYEHAFKHRESLRLLADGLDDRIPIQYRFLSLYKFLEIRFRNEKDHWDFEALQNACTSQINQYNQLRLPRPLPAELQHLRDRCAHIRTGIGKKRRLGITSLNPLAQKEVSRLMPVLIEICRSVFNSETEGRVTFVNLRPLHERASVHTARPADESIERESSQTATQPEKLKQAYTSK
ncbi:hypothetical protein [Burkholderia gladioli]|uniref:hypothetical protein n=1 Tax=Burkholderia gladioli TaxID=28095 RepID=UPI001640115A|nr:hypothetical protein [Burkholderia gladioli]